MSAGSATNRTLVVVLVVLGALVLTSCCCVAAVFLFANSASEAYELSGEQQAIVDDFGSPDDFTVMFGEIASEEYGEDGKQPTHRIEYWNYRGVRLTIVFRDGRFIREQELEPLPDGDWKYPALDPTQIYEGMTAEQVQELIGQSPDDGVMSDASTGLDLTTVSFASQVLATFDGDRLAMIRTLPVLPESQ